MPLHKPSNDALSALLHCRFPAAQAAGSVSPLPGSSGQSMLVDWAGVPLVARRQSLAQQNGVSLHRHYRTLKRLPPGLGPQPYALGNGWLVSEFIAGDVLDTLPDAGTLAALLYTLHRQRCLGWRVSLLPLLMRYWQQSDPARRTPLWLRTLQYLRMLGEPQPLRLAPLHMDVHAGNLVHCQGQWRLIDWEYAGDGDIALELAAVSMEDEERRRLICRYARQASLEPAQLLHQVARWRPWVIALMAGWYERHFWQTRDSQFITLANEAWNRLNNN